MYNELDMEKIGGRGIRGAPPPGGFIFHFGSLGPGLNIF